MVDSTAGPSMPTLVPIPDDTNDIELSDDDYQAGLRIRIYLIPIRIQHIRMNTDLDPDPGFWWPKIKKNLQLKFFFFFKSKS